MHKLFQALIDVHAEEIWVEMPPVRVLKNASLTLGRQKAIYWRKIMIAIYRHYTLDARRSIADIFDVSESVVSHAAHEHDKDVAAFFIRSFDATLAKAWEKRYQHSEAA